MAVCGFVSLAAPVIPAGATTVHVQLVPVGTTCGEAVTGVIVKVSSEQIVATLLLICGNGFTFTVFFHSRLDFVSNHSGVSR